MYSEKIKPSSNYRHTSSNYPICLNKHMRYYNHKYLSALVLCKRNCEDILLHHALLHVRSLLDFLRALNYIPVLLIRYLYHRSLGLRLCNTCINKTRLVPFWNTDTWLLLNESISSIIRVLQTGCFRLHDN